MSERTTRAHCAIGIDLGKRLSQVCVIENEVIVKEFSVAGTRTAFRKAFEFLARDLVVMEVGGASPWVSRLLTELGFPVTVVKSTALKELFHRGRRKNDRNDARSLAEIAALKPTFFRAVQHRSEQAQRDLARIRQRAAFVDARTMLVNTVRGTVSSLGVRLPSCSTAAFPKRAAATLEEQDHQLVAPLLRQIESLTLAIRRIDRELETMAQERYSVTRQLTQVHGVGTQTALTFVLTVTDPRRFRHNRQIGPYLGLVPQQYQSGDSNPQLRITKAGDRDLRSLLVQCAQYMLGHFGRDSDLRRFGLAIAARGGTRSKKRAVVAVARRLAVLLLSLWRTGEVYEPLRNEQKKTLRQSA